MTPEQERAVAEALAEGLSERQAAKRTGVSPTAVHRLRERLAPGEDHRADDGAELGELRAQREQVSADLAAAQADAAGRHREADERRTEWLAVAEEGGDAATLRPAVRDAQDAAEESGARAGGLTRRLAALDQQIAAATERIHYERLLAELPGVHADHLDAAVQEGPEQRDAVLAVRAAAERFVAAPARRQAAAAREQALYAAVTAMAERLGVQPPVLEPVPDTHLWVPADYMAGQPVHLARALSASRDGRTAQVAAELGEAFGWLPPSAELLAAEAARQQALMAAQEQPQAPAPARPVQEPPPGWPAEFGVSSDDVPLRPPVPSPPQDFQSLPFGGPRRLPDYVPGAGML